MVETICLHPYAITPRGRGDWRGKVGKLPGRDSRVSTPRLLSLDSRRDCTWVRAYHFSARCYV